MLPDRLSGDLCSIHEGVERPCLAVSMTIDKSGNKLKQTFHRGNIKSVASLNYEEVENAIDGEVNERVRPYLENVIKPLYNCYACLKKSKQTRQPLDLDLPERKVELFKNGKVKEIIFKEKNFVTFPLAALAKDLSML